ncbi:MULTISPECIES: DUF4145 domain-containing protein [Lactobacillus]|uniref:DUF4145 domain-containing protein n=1 Tax=Lactobacillus TaxID=1578 RepID=UPI000CD9B453|nr:MULTISPECIES: DUF4145 domain-containing protein [Lactobacillus]
MIKINFDFLKDDSLLKEQYDSAARLAKLYEIDDYRDVVINARLLIETVVKAIFKWENLNRYYPLHNGDHRNLRSDSNFLRENLNYPLSIFNLIDEVRRMGNEAVHDIHYHFTKEQAWHVLCAVNDILVFLINSYEDKHLHYLRPDMMMEALENKTGRFRPVKNKAQTANEENVMQAKQLLANKKKKRGLVSRIKKIFKY